MAPSGKNPPVVLTARTFYPISVTRFEQEPANKRLNYMASRLRTALFTWDRSHCEDDAAFAWWWDGLKHELVSVLFPTLVLVLMLCKTAAMSVVGHAAAFGVFLDIPAFLRGLSDCMDGSVGPVFQLSQCMWDEIERPLDPHDTTERVTKYYDDWWNRAGDNPRPAHRLLDLDKAYEFHREKVQSIHCDEEYC